MNNFELYNPVNYVFGKGQTEKLSTLVPKGAKVLLAYGGGSIFKNGVHNQVKKALSGFELIEFGGIEPNPRFETLIKLSANKKSILFWLLVAEALLMA